MRCLWGIYDEYERRFRKVEEVKKGIEEMKKSIINLKKRTRRKDLSELLKKMGGLKER